MTICAQWTMCGRRAPCILRDVIQLGLRPPPTRRRADASGRTRQGSTTRPPQTEPDLRKPREPAGAERRAKARITHPFPSTVRGVGDAGAPFKCMTVIDNLSADGIYLSLCQRLEVGAALSVVIHVAGLTPGDGPEPHVFFDGVVCRVDGAGRGHYGYAVASRGHQLRYLRFVSAVSAKSCRCPGAQRDERGATSSRRGSATVNTTIKRQKQRRSSP
jgi:hypothetical protein